MILVAVVLVLAIGFVVGLGLLGVLGSLAPRDLLILLGISFSAGLAGILVYRGALQRWVQGGRHPLSLRIAAAILAVLLWAGICQLLFWSKIATAPAWNGDPASATIAAVVYTTLLVALLAVSLAAPKRYR